jgi:3'-5' exoribonuclease
LTRRAVRRKTRYIHSIKKNAADGREFSDLFAVKAKNLATSSRDKPYLRLTLGDKSGTIDAFIWDNAVEYGSQIREGDIVEVRCRPQIHREVPQLRVDLIESLSDKDLEGIDRSEFRPGLDLPTRRRLWDQIRQILDQIENPSLRALVREFTTDDRFCEAFLEGAAAKSFHHAYVGGLADHTLAVLRLALAVCEFYPERLNRDLLLAGAFLHDVAKIEEFDAGTGNYTDRGQLLGHIAIGARMLRERTARIPDFPESLLLQVEHMILSHHEKGEWGSPVEPKTMEAMALHYLDNLDAKLVGAWAWLEGEEVPEGSWSSYWRGLGRPLFRTPRPDMAPVAGQDPAFENVENEFLEMEKRAESQEEGEEPEGREPAEADRRAPAKPPRRDPPGQGRLF